MENDCFYIRKRRDLYGVGRNNRSGYDGDAIASYDDAITSYVIAHLLRNTAVFVIHNEVGKFTFGATLFLLTACFSVF